MRVGVPREIKDGERRVGVTPAGVRALAADGHAVLVERGAGANVGFDDGHECLFYNAGVSPDARDLSPGVTGTAAYLRDRMAAGRRRFDFLRGDEPYKYEWGAIDEPIYRLLVERFV